MQNYAIISGTIPINDKSDTANDFKVDLKLLLNLVIRLYKSYQISRIYAFSYDDVKLFKLSDDKVGTIRLKKLLKTFGLLLVFRYCRQQRY